MVTLLDDQTTVRRDGAENSAHQSDTTRQSGSADKGAAENSAPVADLTGPEAAQVVAGHPLSLSDDQLTAIVNAAQPLAPDRRSDFLQAVAAELSQHPAEVGDGELYRVLVTLQRQFFAPPDLSRSRDQSRWR